MTQRVIKYRAWDTSKNRMYYHFDFPDQYLMMLDCTIFDLKGADELGLGLGSAVHDRFMLMQFTGLLDKHGKEIYEHDLYRRYSYVYRVEWDKDSASFAGIVVGRYDNNGENYSPCTSDRLFNISEDEETELVGNIYTTPELVDPKMIER